MVESINIHIGLTGEEEIQRQLAQTATSFAAATKNISALGSTMEQALNGAAEAAKKFGASSGELAGLETRIRAIGARARDGSLSFAELAANQEKVRNSAGAAGAVIAEATPKLAAFSRETETLAARVLRLGSTLSGLGSLGALAGIGQTGGGAGLAVSGFALLGAGLVKLASSAAAAAKAEETAVLDSQLKIQAAYQSTADARQKLSDLVLQAGRAERAAALSDRQFADQRQQNIRTEESAEINLARLKLQAARDSGRISQAQFDQESRLLDARSKRIAIEQAEQAVVDAGRAQADADAKRVEELEDRKQAAIKKTAEVRKAQFALVQQLRDEDKLLEEEGQKTRIDRKLTGAGLVLSEQDRNALKDFQEALNTLDATFDRLKQKFAAGFAGALAEQLDKVTAGALTSGKAFEELGKQIGATVATTIQEFNALSNAWSKVQEKLHGISLAAAAKSVEELDVLIKNAEISSLAYIVRLRELQAQLAQTGETGKQSVDLVADGIRSWVPAINEAARAMDEFKTKIERTIIPRQLPPEKLAQPGPTEEQLAPRLGETNEQRAGRIAIGGATDSYKKLGQAAKNAGEEGELAGKKMGQAAKNAGVLIDTASKNMQEENDSITRNMEENNRSIGDSAEVAAKSVELIADKYAKAAQAARDAAIAAKEMRDFAERDVMTGQKQISAFDPANMIFASGGLVRGRAGRDTNLAWLSNLEYVMRPEAVRKYGIGLMHTINNMQFPGFATGGLNLTLPAFAAGGSAAGMSNVTIAFPGLPPISGLRASSDVVDQLHRAAALAQVRSGGRKPSRYS